MNLKLSLIPSLRVERDDCVEGTIRVSLITLSKIVLLIFERLSKKTAARNSCCCFQIINIYLFPKIYSYSAAFFS